MAGLTARRLPRALLARGLGWGTRRTFLTAALRRRFAPRSWYEIRLGRGHVLLSHDDYAVDWETLKSIVVDQIYAHDYRGTVVVDIGAHKGYFGAYALERGARAVYSYEPESANFAVLERTAELYRKHGVDWWLARSAVGVEDGVTELHVMSASWGHALAPPAEWAKYEIGTESVSVRALSSVLRDAATLAGGAGLVVKINAEGAECQMILGAAAESWTAVTDAFVSTHAWAPCGADELVHHLGRVGLERLPPRGDAHHIVRLGR